MSPEVKFLELVPGRSWGSPETSLGGSWGSLGLPGKSLVVAVGSAGGPSALASLVCLGLPGRSLGVRGGSRAVLGRPCFCWKWQTSFLSGGAVVFHIMSFYLFAPRIPPGKAEC